MKKSSEEQIETCQRKTRYETHDEAKAAVKQQRRDYGSKRYIYKCQVCGDFHLTKHNVYCFGMTQEKRSAA